MVSSIVRLFFGKTDRKLRAITARSNAHSISPRQRAAVARIRESLLTNGLADVSVKRFSVATRRFCHAEKAAIYQPSHKHDLTVLTQTARNVSHHEALTL